MGNSLEIRVPFLDHRLIEFMAQIPSKYKISGLDEKHILKKTFVNRIPKEIIHRNKQPYRAPVSGSLLNDKIGDYTKAILSEKNLKNAGIFDPESVMHLIEKLEKSARRSELENMALISVLSTQIIYDQFITNFSYKKHNINPIIFDHRTNS